MKELNDCLFFMLKELLSFSFTKSKLHSYVLLLFQKQQPLKSYVNT